MSTPNYCLYCGTPRVVTPTKMAGDVVLEFLVVECDCDQAAKRAELETAKWVRIEYSGGSGLIDIDEAVRDARSHDLDMVPSIADDHIILHRNPPTRDEGGDWIEPRALDEEDLYNAQRAIESVGGVPGKSLPNIDEADEPLYSKWARLTLTNTSQTDIGHWRICKPRELAESIRKSLVYSNERERHILALEKEIARLRTTD